jgi:SAM-dependent methyltransferase
MDNVKIKRDVVTHYSELAVVPSCCGVPDGGCLAPLAQIAKPGLGDVVVDVGSGPGFDVCALSKTVGGRGMVIGVDLSPKMIQSAAQRARASQLGNVEFSMADAERIPLASGSADMVVSNCVISLLPNKRQALREVARLLKPGGRAVLADEVALQPFDAARRANMDEWCRCISGAMTSREYRSLMKGAGLRNVRVEPLRHRDQSEVERTGVIDALVVGVKSKRSRPRGKRSR